MTRLHVCAAFAALAIGPAFAAGHDTQLESWIKEHVASNMGELRSGIDLDAKPWPGWNDQIAAVHGQRRLQDGARRELQSVERGWTVEVVRAIERE